MYRFAAGPTQSRRWIFHAECLTRVATNGPYTTTQHPSLSKISVGGCRRVGSALRQEYTRANRCPPSALRAPIRLNSARIPASSPLLACKTRLSFVVPSQPLHRSTQAFCRSSKCSFGLRAWLTRSTPCPLTGRELCSSPLPPPGKGLGLLFARFDRLRLVGSSDDSIATFSFAENLKSWLL